MIEMAGVHVRFIPDVIYIYNDANSLNFYHNHMDKQRAIEAQIRGKQRYKPSQIPPYIKMGPP